MKATKVKFRKRVELLRRDSFLYTRWHNGIKVSYWLTDRLVYVNFN